MARTIGQAVPKPPPTYDQTYIAQLVDAINRFMFQQEAPGEIIAARFVMVLPVHIPGDQPTTKDLPTGMMILKPFPGQPAGTYYLTLVTPQDPK